MNPIPARRAGVCARTGEPYPAGALIVKGAKGWQIARDRQGNAKVAPPPQAPPDFRVLRKQNGQILEGVNINQSFTCGVCCEEDGVLKAARAGTVDMGPYRMERTGDDFVCARSHRIHILTEEELWGEVTLPNLHFTEEHSLNRKVGPSRWEQIKGYFEYVRFHALAEAYEDQDDFERAREYEGMSGGDWFLRRGADVPIVEELLGILPHNRLDVLRTRWADEKRQAREEAERRRERAKVRAEQFARLFDRAEGAHLWGEDMGLTEGVSLNSGRIPLRLTGTTVPIGNGQTPYGGGQWFVLDADGAHVWHVRNNGMDGDNWSHNNIVTGGAGAIGLRFELTDERRAYVRETLAEKGNDHAL
jgi:hypothetical protein